MPQSSSRHTISIFIKKIIFFYNIMRLWRHSRQAGTMSQISQKKKKKVRGDCRVQEMC